MKKMIKRVVPAALAMSLAVAPAASYGSEFQPSPGSPYAPEVMAKLEDNTMEYGEIEMLIDTYNTNLKNLRESYADSKDSMKDIAAVKDTIEDSSDMILDGASQMSNAAAQLENSIGFGLPIPGLTFAPGTYAELVYNAAVLEYQAEQVLLSADQLTEMSPEMMKIQMIDSPRAMLISGAQSLLIAYENIRVQKAMIVDAVELAEAAVQTTERLASVGMGTVNEVNAAKQGLSTARAGLITLEAAEVNLRQQLCTMLGWAYDADPEIPAIPAVDVSRVDAMNLEADIQSALSSNFTLKYNRLSEDTLTDGSVQMENLHRTIQAEEAEIATSMTKLYHDVLQARSDLYNAQTTQGQEQTNLAAADRKWSLGMISKMEHMQAQNAYTTAEINVRVAELALLQALETYDWAVKGNLTLSQ